MTNHPARFSEVLTPGMRHGANHEKRIEYENVYVFRKPR